MRKSSGIEIEKNTQGVLTMLHVDLTKHANDDDILNFLNKNGISYKTSDDYISKAEVHKQTTKFISTLNWSK
jgi:hypothetical protein